jgi:hypothetical protein
MFKDTMGDERDIFASLEWEKEIRSLGDPHVLFNPSPEHDKGAGKQCSDDYELILFSQSTQSGGAKTICVSPI